MSLIRQITHARLLLKSGPINPTYMPFTFNLPSSRMPRWNAWTVWKACAAQLGMMCDSLLGLPNPHNPVLAVAPAGTPSIMDVTRPHVEDAALSWDGFLFAAPKKKVSHSRKAMRAANKGLKDRVGTYDLKEKKAHTRHCALPRMLATEIATPPV